MHEKGRSRRARKREKDNAVTIHTYIVLNWNWSSLYVIIMPCHAIPCLLPANKRPSKREPYVYDFELKELIIFRIVKRSINSIKETTQTNHQFGRIALHTLFSKIAICCGICCGMRTVIGKWLPIHYYCDGLPMPLLFFASWIFHLNYLLTTKTEEERESICIHISCIRLGMPEKCGRESMRAAIYKVVNLILHLYILIGFRTIKECCLRLNAVAKKNPNHAHST